MKFYQHIRKYLFNNSNLFKLFNIICYSDAKSRFGGNLLERGFLYFFWRTRGENGGDFNIFLFYLFCCFRNYGLHFILSICKP